MRKAFYYDNAIPSKKWLITASLLWNKIWISPLIINLITAQDTFPELNNEFLTSLYKKAPDIFDISTPKIDESKFKNEIRGEKLDKYKKIVIEHVNEIKRGFIRPENMGKLENLKEKTQHYLNIGDRQSALKMVNLLTSILNSEKSEMTRKATLHNHGFYNSEYKEYYPELDYFFDNESSFKNCYPNCNKVLIYSVEAHLPVNPESISIQQIKDFRERTISQRIKFKIASEEFLNKLMLSSTEADFDDSLKVFKEILENELNSFSIVYRECKIEALNRAITIFSATTLLPFIESSLSIPIYVPAGIISSLSLTASSVLSAIEKGKTEIHKSPWGYLTSLKRLKKG
jgi:hypothetical protein